MGPRQTPIARAVRWALRATTAATAAAATAPGLAQETAPAVFFRPALSVSEIATDLRGSPTRPNGSDLATRLSPSLSFTRNAGRVQGTLDYTINSTIHSARERGGETLNALQAALRAEAIERWAYVDATASISQQSLSPYGLQTSPDSASSNPNRVEVGTAQVSPYLKGILGDAVSYEIRGNVDVNEVKGSSDSDSTTTGAAINLASSSQRSRLGWSASLSQQAVRFKTGRRTDNDRLGLGVLYTPAFDLKLKGSVGQESTNVGSATRRTSGNWGVGAVWTPTERTDVQLQTDHRYFGQSHSLTLQHRLRRASFGYTDRRDSTSGGDATGVGRPLTLYQVLFAQFESAQPDPVLRQQAVLDFLASIGRSPNEIQQGGTLSSAISLQRRQDLSAAWLGQRVTLNLQAFTSRSRVLDDFPGALDPGETRVTGYNGTISYKLTPTASLSLGGSRQITTGSDLHAGTDLKSVSVSWTDRISQRLNASVAARYTSFSSVTDPYRETGVTATLGMQF